MLIKIRRELAVGGAIAMLAMVILTTGTLFAQSATSTPASSSMPASDQTGMMDMASPAADATWMEQCMAMMQMMMGGGDMSGMTATPGAGMGDMIREGMGTPVSGT